MQTLITKRLKNLQVVTTFETFILLLCELLNSNFGDSYEDAKGEANLLPELQEAHSA